MPTTTDALAVRACGRALIEVVSTLHDQLPPRASGLREDLRETRVRLAELMAGADAGNAAGAFDFLAGKSARVGACFALAATLRLITADAAERGMAITDALLEDAQALASVAT